MLPTGGRSGSPARGLGGGAGGGGAGQVSLRNQFPPSASTSRGGSFPLQLPPATRGPRRASTRPAASGGCRAGSTAQTGVWFWRLTPPLLGFRGVTDVVGVVAGQTETLGRQRDACEINSAF